MRTHCISVCDADGNHEGDICLMSPWLAHPDRSLLFYLDESLQTLSGVIALSASEVRQLREACDAFLVEQDKDPFPRRRAA